MRMLALAVTTNTIDDKSRNRKEIRLSAMVAQVFNVIDGILVYKKGSSTELNFFSNLMRIDEKMKRAGIGK
jgi:hypothetical protein